MPPPASSSGNKFNVDPGSPSFPWYEFQKFPSCPSNESPNPKNAESMSPTCGEVVDCKGSWKNGRSRESRLLEIEGTGLAVV